MSVTSLQHKTVRPGSLVGYSYYHSDRRPFGTPRGQTAARPIRLSISQTWLRRLLLTGVVLAALIGLPLLRGGTTPAGQQLSYGNSPAGTPTANFAAAAGSTANHCAGNGQDQLIVVSINQRQLWACQKSHAVYDSPVITGMEAHDSTLTPIGTYHVYAKQTNLTLTGSDVTGSWSDPVQYWMPFLNNQFGTYGFHDATWRPNSAFGKISPQSGDASHGCVELPLATSQWLYGWTQVGTTVKIED